LGAAPHELHQAFAGLAGVAVSAGDLGHQPIGPLHRRILVATLRGREALLQLRDEVQARRPQGGAVGRGIEQALQACASATLASRR